MVKEPMSIRLEPQEREALARAAAADKRQPAALARLILAEWLAAHGYLGQPSPPSAPATPRRRRGGRQP